MAEEQVQGRATGEPTAKRSLTGDLSTMFVQGVAGGAGLATGKVIVDQIVGHVTNKPQDPPEPPQQVILPQGVERE